LTKPKYKTTIHENMNSNIPTFQEICIKKLSFDDLLVCLFFEMKKENINQILDRIDCLSAFFSNEEYSRHYEKVQESIHFIRAKKIMESNKIYVDME